MTAGRKMSVLQSNGTSSSLIPCNPENDIVASAEPISSISPLESSYNTQIRPLLDAIDKLRDLEVTKEGIQLPTIVVVGDQSSGKSSVLESLSGISLPRGQGICTRMPLVMRLLHNPGSETELKLEYSGKEVYTDEEHVAEDIVCATEEVAGSGKDISNTPLTLEVRKDGVPDLTMVDLPGITRVPVHGQPQNIYEQIKGIIMEYIRPEESIILNVLSATVDFATCESIMMSQEVDKTGERTLAVVTKVDKHPEGLHEKVTADDVNIGLGYVCVRNRIGDDESYEQARIEEARLFARHPELSKIRKNMVGIPVLAQKLMEIQANIIARCLPDIVSKINEKLSANVEQLNKLPKKLGSAQEAMTSFMQIIRSVEQSLAKILIRAEFDEYPNDDTMHCTARLAERLSMYSTDLQSSAEEELTSEFLMDEISVLEEGKGISLPNFLPRSAFHAMLRKRIDKISAIPEGFVGYVWDYIECILNSVLGKHTENYPRLMSTSRRAVSNVICRMKENSVERVKENVEMEKLTDYTINPDYLSECNELMSQYDLFIRVMKNEPWRESTRIEGFGDVSFTHLTEYSHLLQQAYDLKMRMTAYWKIVHKRMVDFMGLHVMFMVHNLVKKDLESQIVEEVMGPNGGGIEMILEQSAAVAGKRRELSKSVKLLMEAKDIVSRVMDRVPTCNV